MILNCLADEAIKLRQCVTISSVRYHSSDIKEGGETLVVLSPSTRKRVRSPSGTAQTFFFAVEC